MFNDLTHFIDDFHDLLYSQRITADDDSGKLQIALPGYGKEDINVKVENDHLIVSCDTDFKADEYWKHKFRRSYQLSGMVDKESIKASMLNGILTISIGKDKTKTADITVE